jgi:hypothetical protein
MKKILLLVAVVVMTALDVQAQSLAGRKYYNANIIASLMDGEMDNMEQKIDSAKHEALVKAEQKKGRQLTAAEKAEVEQKAKEAQQMIIAVRKGMSTAITVEFTTEKNATMKVKMKVSDDVLKAAGIPWLKRKAMKAALAVAPSTMKATYEVKGNLVILNDDGDLDTLRLSADGKQLQGTFDKKTPFTLTRTQ